MKILNFTKQLAAVAVVAALFTACDKAKVADPIGDRGQTVVKVLGGGPIDLSATPQVLPPVIKKPVDFVSTPTKLLVFDVRRDIPNETELNKTIHVTVKDDTAAVTAVDPGYIPLDPSLYTIDASTPKTGGVGGTFDLTFAPGEFAKPIYIIIPDATLLDPSSLYALGFTITTSDVNGIISSSRSAVIEIGAKNDWDGVYLRSGTFSDVTNAALTDGGDQQYSLITAGAVTCYVVNDDLNGGIPGYFFLNAGAGTYYGSYGYVIDFNPANNTIADLHNYYGDRRFPATSGGNPALGSDPPLYAASNTRRAVLDPSGVNAVQANKDILIKHWLVQPSVVAVGPRAYFNDTWAYLGPR
ncbi:MAG: hypothetical protein ABI741_07945 [Ferruginibacter sp.]